MSDNGTHEVGAIRELRAAAGLSQEALAREVGCSTAYVRVLERGYAPDPGASPVYRRVLDALDAASNDNGGPAKAAAVQEPGGHPRHGQV
jgi:transcriptional regulator with XRE-family HTH domain